MHRVQKLTALFLALALLLCLITVTAFANGPAIAPFFYIKLQNLPEGTVYVDLLIPLEKNDAMYTPLEQKNLPEGFSPDAPIVAFHEDGYCSYTFHCEGASSAIAIQSSPRDPHVVFFADATMSHESTRYDHEEYAQKKGFARLALLDSAGNILQLSAPHRINSNKLFTYSYGSYIYDAASDMLTVKTASSGIGIPLYFICSLLGLLLTVLSEQIVCRWFRLRDRYGKLVVCVNILSQIAMRAVHLLLYSLVFFDYAWTTLYLEAAVFLCEYLIYRRRMHDVSAKACALFTFTANLVSFILGFGLNQMLFFRI